MNEYTKEFDDWWYKPLLESAKWSGGVPDKDMMRYKDLGKQSAFHAWVAREQEITRLKKALEIANEALVKIDSSNDDMKYFNSEIDSILKEAQKQIKEVLEG